MANEHLKAFADIPSVSLSGIYSRTKSRAEALASLYGINYVCDSIEELFEKTQADILVIAVPELSARDVCFEAFKHNWLCLIEKPAGYNIEDASAIRDEAQRLKVRAYVALNRRHFNSTHVVLKGLADDPNQRLIHIQDQEDIIAARNGGQPELVLKNWMYANAIHIIDYLRIFGRGEILSVNRVVKWNPENPGFVIAVIHFSSGDIGLYEALWNVPAPWAIFVTTRQKRWELIRPVEQAAFQVYGSRKLEVVEQHEWDNNFKPGLRLQAEETIKAFLGQTHNLPTLQDAFESMLIAEKIYLEDE